MAGITIYTLVDIPEECKYSEDGLVSNHPFFAVFDGYSAPYCGDPPMFCYGGQKLTGGQIIRQITMNYFHTFSPEVPLQEAILFVNREIRLKATSLGWPIANSDVLPGASFVFAKVGPDEIEVIQGGDCFALWMYNSGKLGITPSQFYEIGLELKQKIAQLMQRHQDDRQKMREDFLPFLQEQRRRDVNRSYAILNGQYALSDLWQRVVIPIQDLSLLLLFSDGFVPFDETKDEELLAEKIVERWINWGSLGIILDWARSFERDPSKSHVDHAEATALAVQFE